MSDKPAMNNRTQDLELIKGLIEGLHPLNNHERMQIVSWTNGEKTTALARLPHNNGNERLAQILAGPVSWGALERDATIWGANVLEKKRTNRSIVLDGVSCAWEWPPWFHEVRSGFMYYHLAPPDEALAQPLARITPEESRGHESRPFLFLDIASMYDTTAVLENVWINTPYHQSHLFEALRVATGRRPYVERGSTPLRNWLHRLVVWDLTAGIAEATLARSREIARDRYGWASPLDQR